MPYQQVARKGQVDTSAKRVHVVRPIGSSADSGILQRKCDDCRGAADCDCHSPGADAETPSSVHRSAIHPGDPMYAPPSVHQVLRSPGHTLAPETQAFFEDRFAGDLSGVRVHSDAAAAESALAVNSLAYTVGQHVVFGASRYQPDTHTGRKLLAHELAHTLQQGVSQVPRPGELLVTDPLEADEHEAERAARAAMHSRNTVRIHANEHAVARANDRLAIGHIRKRAGTDGSSGAISRQLPSAVQAICSSEPAALQRTAASDTKHNRPEGVESKEIAGERSYSGITSVVGQNPEALLRLDTVTVIELGANDWCAGCVAMRSDLSELAAEITAEAHQLQFRVFSINQETEGNEEVADRIKHRTGAKGVPQTFVYRERELATTFQGYTSGRDYQQEIRDIYESASTPGWKKGLKLGGIIGGIAGAVGFAGLALAGLTGIGALVGLGVAAAGAGLGALLGWSFGTDRGTEKLGAERIKRIRDFAQGDLPDNELDHGLAIDIVNYWAAQQAIGTTTSASGPSGTTTSPSGPSSGPSSALNEEIRLSVEQRIALIENLIEGFTGDAEERAIIKILENSTDSEVVRIVGANMEGDPRGVPIEQAIKENVHGSEYRYLLDLMQSRFPLAVSEEKTAGLLIADNAVREWMSKAYRLSNPGAPPCPRNATPEQRQKCSHEEGGSILRDRSGVLHCEFWPAGTMSHEEIPTQSKGDMKVAATFHTHPQPLDNYTQTPSPQDIKRMTMGVPEFEHYVIGMFTIYLVRPDGSIELVGNTSSLLGVPASAKPGKVQSTLGF